MISFCSGDAELDRIFAGDVSGNHEKIGTRLDASRVQPLYNLDPKGQVRVARVWGKYKNFWRRDRPK